MDDTCYMKQIGSEYGYSTSIAVTKESMPRTLTIVNCEKVKVQLRELDIEFELDPDKLDKIDTLIINGYKYIKEK
jgi:hypothetical protein